MIASLFLLSAPPRIWGEPVQVTTLKAPEITESSGLAASTQTKGVWYTHNDSGDTARFFRFDLKGNVTGIFSLKGVKAVDWEEMASQTLKGVSYLYLGDTGDNGLKRQSIQIHRVVEPKGPGRELSEVVTWTIKYQDKPRDCEAFFIAPKTGDLWLISKARDGETCAYVVRKPSGTGEYVAVRKDRMAVNTGGMGGKLVTGGAISPDGRHVAIRTYSGALEFDAGGSLNNWFLQKPTPLTIAKEAQGESISYSPDGRSLFTTSEGSPCSISRISLKVKG